MANKAGVSLNPKNFKETVEDMAFHARPPKYTSDEMDGLDFHNRRGLAVVKEVLEMRPVPSLSYRDLSRIALHIALDRISKNQTILALREKWPLYCEAKKNHPLWVRKQCDEIIEAAANGYQPFQKESYVHMWFWDAEERDALTGLISESHLPQSMLYAFAADPLSEIEGIGKVAEDLKLEYGIAVRSAGFILAAVEKATEECLMMANA